MEEEFRYTVLAYEDECGLWLKISETGFQCCTEDLEIGLDILEEGLDYRLDFARKRGEEIPQRRARTVRRVGKDEYGPTQVDIERERYEQELRDEEEAESE